MTAFPGLPAPGARVAEFPTLFPRRHYPAWPGSPGGWAHVRVWETPAGHLAVVTGLGEGVSVADAGEFIHRELAAGYPGELVLIEHCPPSPGRDYHTWDQVTVTGGTVHWRAVWPVPDTNPDYDHLRKWVTAYGDTLGISAANHYPRHERPAAGQMTPARWTVGGRVLIVEHDDATRQVKPDGQVIPATVHRLTDGGVYVQVQTEHHGLLSFYASSGWHAWDGRFRWRLLAPAAVTGNPQTGEKDGQC